MTNESIARVNAFIEALYGRTPYAQKLKLAWENAEPNKVVALNKDLEKLEKTLSNVGDIIEELARGGQK